MINQAALEHNRKKQYLLPEGTAVPFLVGSWGYDKRRCHCPQPL